MPLIGVFASGISGHLGPSAQNFFLRSSVSTNVYNSSVFVRDSSGNTYISGTDSTLGIGGYYASVVQKYNNAGEFVWGKYWTNKGYSCTLTLDSTETNLVVQTNNDERLISYVKLNPSDGSIVSGPVYYSTGITYRAGAELDQNGNYWSAGSTNNGSNSTGLMKVPSNLGTATLYSWGGTYADALACKGSYVYCGLTADSGNNYRAGIAKMNLDGTNQWSKYFGSTYSTGFPTGIAVDSSDNVYYGFWNTDSGFTGGKAFLVKWSSDGTLQWARKLDSGALDQFVGVTLDEANNAVYACGSAGSSGLIAKYNLSGTLQWQRTLTNSSFNDIVVCSTGELQVTGSWKSLSSGGTSQNLILRIPADGSKTGSYTVGGTSVTYAASSLTDTSSVEANGNYGGSASQTTLGANSMTLTSYGSYSPTTQVVTI